MLLKFHGPGVGLKVEREFTQFRWNGGLGTNLTGYIYIYTYIYIYSSSLSLSLSPPGSLSFCRFSIFLHLSLTHGSSVSPEISSLLNDKRGQHLHPVLVLLDSIILLSPFLLLCAFQYVHWVVHCLLSLFPASFLPSFIPPSFALPPPPPFQHHLRKTRFPRGATWALMCNSAVIIAQRSGPECNCSSPDKSPKPIRASHNADDVNHGLLRHFAFLRVYDVCPRRLPFFKTRLPPFLMGVTWHLYPLVGYVDVDQEASIVNEKPCREPWRSAASWIISIGISLTMTFPSGQSTDTDAGPFQLFDVRAA